jgi:hypothetical protein
MKSIVGAICIGLAMTGTALSEARYYNPLKVTCAEYSKIDFIGAKLIPAHQRQNIVVFVIGYVTAEAKSGFEDDDSAFLYAADAMDMICADKKLADTTVVDALKGFLTLNKDVEKLVPKEQ